ncbi:MAG: DNA methyltransferase [Nanoarchaeota archaeon]
MTNLIKQQIFGARGHIFACTRKTEKECFDRMIFSSNKIYSDKVAKVKKGDVLFLYNLDADAFHGPFTAKSEGGKNIAPEAWGGKYPYQVEVEKNGDIKTIRNARKMLKMIGIDWKNEVDAERMHWLINYLHEPEKVDLQKLNAKKLFPSAKVKEHDEKPPLISTTLWDYQRQSYGKSPKGSNKYPGVTPAFIIYNLIKRYTEREDLVLDPMAGSGTTLDICKDEGRQCIAYDIAPPRKDIIQNDARNIPLSENSVDMLFIDSPYGDNIRYNEHPDDIGKISAETDTFYEELEKVMKECYRVLKPGKVLGWLIGDQWVKRKFTPVGFKVYQRLSKYFDTVDVISVVRRGQTSNTGIWHNRALRFNFYLRGFKYLFIMKKPFANTQQEVKRKVEWHQYKR